MNDEEREQTISDLFDEFERWCEDPEAVRQEWATQRRLHELAELGVVLLGRPPIKEAGHE